MRMGYFVPAAMLAAALFCHSVPAQAASEASLGEQAFVKHCAVCHPKGENIIKPSDSLFVKNLAAKGIREPADIVRKMRNPGPGMTQFDEKAITDATAMAIAKYVLETFK
jgi:cytochrome c6